MFKKRRVFLSDRLECYAGVAPPPDVTLADALSRLPEKLRTPLLLRYMEGFSVTETAGTLHVPETTVRSRLYRARKALREELDGEEAGRR